MNLLLARTVEDLPHQEVVLTAMNYSVQVVTPQSSSQCGSSSLCHLKSARLAAPSMIVLWVRFDVDVTVLFGHVSQ